MITKELPTAANFVRETVESWTISSPQSSRRGTRKGTFERLRSFADTDSGNTFKLSMVNSEIFVEPKKTWVGRQVSRIVGKVIKQPQPHSEMTIIYTDLINPENGRTITAQSQTSGVDVVVGAATSWDTEPRSFNESDYELVNTAVQILITQGVYSDPK
jgi:hypothetical protein